MGKRKVKKKGANDKDSNVNADGIPEESREIVQNMKEAMVNFSEQEIYATLLDCNMKPYFAFTRLLSQAHSQEVESNQGEKKENTDTLESFSQGVDSSIQNSKLVNSDDHDVDHGGEDKLNSDETSHEQGTSNQLAETLELLTVLCSETNHEQGISNQLADSSTTSSILVPYKSDLAKPETRNVPVRSREVVRSVRPPTRMISASGQTMANILKGRLGLSSKEKPDATNPPSTSLTESGAARAQLEDSASLFYSKFPYEDQVINPFSYAAAKRNQLQEYFASVSNQNMRHGPARENHFNFSSATDFTFAPPELNLQHQELSTREPDPQYSTLLFGQSMLRQSIPTAPSLDLRLPTLMTEATITTTNFEPQRYPQAMNHHSSQLQEPSWQHGNMMNSPYSIPNHNQSYNMLSEAASQERDGSYSNTLALDGNIMNSPYWRQQQNDSYNMPPSAAFQQHDDTNNNPYLHQSLDSVLSLFRNSNLLHSATFTDASAPGSAYGFGMSSDNAENSRFGYEDVSRNHLPSIQHQGGNTNVWRVQGEDVYYFIPPNRRLSRFRHSQQEQEPYRGTGSDTSGQTKQRLCPRDDN